jgi:RimJ/RimL family protein N-acetyltransferase
MTTTDKPDWQPTLASTQLELAPLRAQDFEPLYAVASDPLLWEQHPEPTRHERPVFERWFAAALASGGALCVRAATDGSVIGSSRYYAWDPHERTVVVGYTFLARAHWGGATNRELKRLMLAHAFRSASAVDFHVGPGNLRSQRALERIGARLHDRRELVAGDPATIRLVYRIVRAEFDAWS